MKLGPIEWEDADPESEACKENGITRIAFREEVWPGDYKRTTIVGYNGMLKGQKVLLEGQEYTIVMVSRLGDFGLSLTGELPYTVRVAPNEVTPTTPGAPG